MGMAVPSIKISGTAIFGYITSIHFLQVFLYFCSWETAVIDVIYPNIAVPEILIDGTAIPTL